jgi:GNAT superfamily N-acetyltransferase
MNHPIPSNQSASAAPAISPKAIESLSVRPLAEADQGAILSFLAPSGVDNIVMLSLICDNGLVSPLNRGTFYGAYDRQGSLLGVALIGHATLVETRVAAVLTAFADLAARCPFMHVIVGVPQKIEPFWNSYSAHGRSVRRRCCEILFEQCDPGLPLEPVPGLRRAMLEDLAALLTVNAQMACAESGVDPLAIDPQGFRRRLARRIEKGRVWIWTEEERLLFKADLFAETPEVVYLEGVYVHPAERRKGYGRRCMSELSSRILAHSEAIYVLVNEQNQTSQEFLLRCGYLPRGFYDTLFV